MEGQKNSSLIYQSLAPAMIRLLDILPGSGDDPICVKLHTTLMGEAGSYKALSYTWGSATDNLCNIMCDGYEFWVTANLFAALVRFRDASAIQRFWIDAVCIDQSSNFERTQQVGLMRNIYRVAEKVLIWIGNENQNSGLELMFRVADARYDYALGKRMLERSPGDIPHLLFHPDVEMVRIVAEVQNRMMSTAEYEIQDPSHVALLKSPNFLLLGFIQSMQEEAHKTSSEVQVTYPDFSKAQVEATAQTSYTDFDEYLKEAFKPAEWTLSDEEIARVYVSLRELEGRSYWRRAWIVQEVMISSKATIVCGIHEINYESFCAVFGYDRRTDLEIKNFKLDDLKVFDAVENVRILSRVFDVIRSSPNLELNSGSSKGSAALEPSSDSTLSQISYHRLRAQQGQMKETSLGQLLQHYGRQNATDPRDHIFSLAGLLQELSARPEELQFCENLVNYTREYEDVFLEVAKHLVDNFRPRCVDHPKPSDDHILDQFYGLSRQTNLPTWIPDWHASVQKCWGFDTRRRIEIDTVVPYNARVDQKSLFLSAHIVDEIAFVSEQLRIDREMYQEVELFRKFQTDNAGSVYGDADCQFEAFWRTVIVDNPLGSKSDNDMTYHFQEQDAVNCWLEHCRLKYKGVCRIWLGQLELRPRWGPVARDIKGVISLPLNGQKAKIKLDTDQLQDMPNLAGKLDELIEMEDDPLWDYHESRMELSDHCLVKSHKGFFGLVSLGIKPGDIMAVLGGSYNLWCLRKHDQYYRIVGKAWAHGLMYRNDEYYKNRNLEAGGIEEIEFR